MKNATLTNNTTSTFKTFANLNEALRWADRRNPPCYEEDETVFVAGQKVVFTFRDNGEYQYYGFIEELTWDNEPEEDYIDDYEPVRFVSFRNASIERGRHGYPKKVREERDHTDRGHSRRNARGEKGRQW